MLRIFSLGQSTTQIFCLESVDGQLMSLKFHFLLAGRTRVGPTNCLSVFALDSVMLMIAEAQKSTTTTHPHSPTFI
jgi:hypothetical protein